MARLRRRRARSDPSPRARRVDAASPRRRPLEGWRGVAARRSRAPGTYPRIWAYEPIMFAVRDSAAPGRGVRRWPTSARRRRNEWPSIEAAYDAYASKPPLNVMTPGVAARVRRLRLARPRRRHVRAQVPARGRGADLRDGPEPRRVRRSCPTSRRRCGSCAARRAPTSPRRSAPRSRTGSARRARGDGAAAVTSARSRTPTRPSRRCSGSRGYASAARYARLRSSITARPPVRVGLVRRVERAPVDDTAVARA